MLKNVISQGDFAIWPILSTLVFFGTFLAILVWVYRPKGRKHYDHMAQLAMDDHSQKEGRDEC